MPLETSLPSAALEEYGWSGTITWEEVCNAVSRLGLRILNDGYHYDCIVSLTDGGVIVADLLLFNRKFRAGEDLHIPIICLNILRKLESSKKVKALDESYPFKFSRRFKRLLVVDEASRSGKTMDEVESTLKALYRRNKTPPPEIRIAVLGIQEGAAPHADYWEISLLSDETFPWGPFAEHWKRSQR